MTYPPVTQFQTTDNRRRLLLAQSDEARRPGREGLRRQLALRRRLEPCPGNR
jgi:hypothetical protein